jgi:hypothetical protein
MLINLRQRLGVVHTVGSQLSILRNYAQLLLTAIILVAHKKSAIHCIARGLNQEQ